MSLINQVLKDLDQRRISDDSLNEARLEDLYISGDIIRSRRRNWLVISGITLTILTMVMAAGFYWFYKQPHDQTQNVTTTKENIGQPVETKIVQTQPKQIAVPVRKQVIQSAKKAVAQPVKPAVPEDNYTSDDSLPVASSKNDIKKHQVPLRAEQKAELAYQAGYDELTRHHYGRGEKQLRGALAVEPGHVKSRELLSGMLIKQGRWIEANEVLRHGITITPNHQAYVKLYARTLMQMDQDKKAISVLRRYSPAIQNDPEHYALLAALYQRQKDHLSASTTYAEILKVKPNMGIWWVGMAISLEAMGNKPQAQQAYTQARSSGALHGDLARFTDNRLLALDEINFPLN